jgi:hypothetical protein
MYDYHAPYESGLGLNMEGHDMMLRLLAILLALGSFPVIADDAPMGSPEGEIKQYEANGGVMLASTDVNWNRYTGILLEKAAVEFLEDWKREQQRLNNNIVTDHDQMRIKSGMSDMLHEILTGEISGNDRYSLSETRNTNVLRFTPRIAKLNIHAPGKLQAIVGNVLVDSKGSMVIVMEISDSVSG